MSENTAKATDPIWDSRNSDEPDDELLTPRTDEFFDGEIDKCPAAEFCRQLERELNEAKAQQADSFAHAEAEAHAHDECMKRLAAAQKEI